jgi:hypothetical protein
MSKSIFFGHPVRRPRSGRVRLHVEILESRDVPSSFTLGSLVQVSGPSPFNGNPNQPALYRNAETENFVAVDPANPNHAVTAWIQDLAAGIVSAATFDGGATWQEAVVPGLSLVSGGTYPTAADPWVTFAPNGDVYVSSIENHFFEHSNLGNAIRVNKSTDGGRTWGEPATLIEENDSGFNNDEPTITADPRNANFVYAVWFRSVESPQGSPNPRTQTLFTRTTDGGRTWEPAQVIYTSGNDNFQVSHQIIVRPDGTLLDFFDDDLRTGMEHDYEMSVLRSTDRGATWSPPVRLIRLLSGPVADPDTGQLIAAGTGGGISPPKVHIVQDPNNSNLYAVWEDERFSVGQHNSIAFSMSTDGGLTWSAPMQINKTRTDIASGNQQAFLPSVAVAADGTVGVTYYDFRNNTPAAGLPTDYWFVHADPGTALTNPANWGQELRLTNTSFDMEKAPLGPAGLFVGDYEGLAAAGKDFVPTWCMPHTNPDGTIDVASVFSRRISADEPLLAAATPRGGAVAVSSLTSQQLQPLVSEAIARWAAAGANVGGLKDVTFQIADLPGAELGLASGNTITIDTNAAGWGWFVDPTPHDDSEFTTPGNQGEQNRMDLLTVLEHEIGHLLGYNDTDSGLMDSTLAPGIRETPMGVLDLVFAL